MFQILKYSLVFCLLLVNPVLAAKPPKASASDRPGEKIAYAVKLNALSLGTARYTYVGKVGLAGKQVRMSLFETKVTGFYDLEKIYSDQETQLPIKIERTIRKPASREEIVEEYDQKKFALTINKTVGKKKEQQVIQKEGPIHNAILLPFSVRHLAELKEGWSIDATLPTQQFKIKLVGTEKVKVPSGSFDCYHFTSQPPRFEIWITKDSRRIPVKIKGSGGIGYTLLMKEYK